MKQLKEGDSMPPKRINLYFDTNNERMRKAYDIIYTHAAKTAFIVDAVLSYTEGNAELNKNAIKEALREVITELGLEIKNEENKNNEDEAIPDEIFNMLSEL